MTVRRCLTVLSLSALLLLPGYALAEITTSHLYSDVDMVALLTDTIFVAEGRIGDLGGGATFELDLGQSTSNPAVTEQYGWQSGVQESFTLSYDAVTGLVTYSLGGKVLNYTTPFVDFGDIFVRARAVDESTSVTVTDLVIDGEVIGDFSSTTGPGGLDILWISGAPLQDGFTVTGVATLEWSGSPPSQSRLAFQIKVAEIGYIAIEKETWGRIKNLYRE